MYFQRITTTALFMTLLAFESTRADILADETKKSSNGKGKGLRGVADDISSTIFSNSNHSDDVDVGGSARILGSTQTIQHSIGFNENMDTEYNKSVKIQGSLYQNTGGSMTVYGDLTISDSFYKNTANICVNGDLTVVSGDFYKNKGKIYVNGDLVVARGEYYKNENVVVQGDIHVVYDDDFYRYENTEKELKGALTKDAFRSFYLNNC